MDKIAEGSDRLLITSRRGVRVVDRVILITCQECRTEKPFAKFGARMMDDGGLRNQPWCIECRDAQVHERKLKKATNARAP